MSEWFAENWFSLTSIFALILGGIFAIIQWNKNIKLKHAEFIIQIIEKLRFDKSMADAMYLIDYDGEWYSEDFHGSGEKEFTIDKLLSYFSYICYLEDVHHITKKEFSILEYELRRACDSSQIQGYLFNLYHFSRETNSTCSFQYLIDYGLREGIIKKDVFTNKNSDEYPHYLSF